VEIEFDPAKDAKNRRERGLPLALGAVVLANLVVEFEDDRRDYGERRMIAVGTIAGRLHVCVYTMRGTMRRILSLRKANPKEVRKWQGSP
jgi:uncharacterized DUF497 family protein